MLVAAAVALVTTESIVLPVGLPQRWLAGDGSSPSPLPRTRRGPAPENLGPRVGLARARGPGPSFGRRTGAPAVSGLGRVAVDPERHGDDVGRYPQELKISGVDAPVMVQVGDHVRGIVVDAVVIEVVDDRDGERGVDILTGDGRAHDPGVPQLGLLGIPVGDAGEVEQAGQVGAWAGETRKGVVGGGGENDQAGHAVVLAGREGAGERRNVVVHPGPGQLQTAEPGLVQVLAQEVDFHVDEPAESAGPGVGAPLGREDLDPYRLGPLRGTGGAGRRCARADGRRNRDGGAYGHGHGSGRDDTALLLHVTRPLSGDLVRLEAAAGERPARSPAVRSSSSMGAPLPTTA